MNSSFLFKLGVERWTWDWNADKNPRFHSSNVLHLVFLLGYQGWKVGGRSKVSMNLTQCWHDASRTVEPLSSRQPPYCHQESQIPHRFLPTSKMNPSGFPNFPSRSPTLFSLHDFDRIPQIFGMSSEFLSTIGSWRLLATNTWWSMIM